MSGYDLRCFICRRRKATQLDHCHTCGRYRGWLCNRCNSQIQGDKVKNFYSGTEVVRIPGPFTVFANKHGGIGTIRKKFLVRRVEKRSGLLEQRAKSYLEKHFAECVKPPFPVRRIRWDSKWRRRAQKWEKSAGRWQERCMWLEHRFGHPTIDWEHKRIRKRAPQHAVPPGFWCEWCKKERS